MSQPATGVKKFSLEISRPCSFFNIILDLTNLKVRISFDDHVCRYKLGLFYLNVGNYQKGARVKMFISARNNLMSTGIFMTTYTNKKS